MKSIFIKLLPVIIILFFQNTGFGRTPAPIIVTQPANQTVCAGNSASFTVTAIGVGLTYQWRKGNVNLIDTGSISGATTATLTINPTTVNDSSSYYNVIVSEPLQPNDTSNNASLTVYPAPVAFTGPPRTICYGDTIAIGGPAAANTTYKWTPNRGLSSYTVSNPMASPTDTTKYTLTVKDTLTGCQSIDSLVITVKPVPDADIIQGDTVSFCTRDSITLTATNGARFIWSNGDTTKNITVYSPGIFSVGITYANGCVDYSDPTTVINSALPVANAGPGKSICNGDSVQIGTAAISGLTYSWSPASGLNYDTIAQPTAKPTVTTTYTLTVTSSTCTNKDSIVVTIMPKPLANAGPDKTICKDDSTSIGSVSVLGMSYSWSPANGLSSSTASQPKASPAISTTYTLTVSNGSCSNTDTVIVNVNPTPVANAGPNKSICNGDSTSIGTVSVSGIRYSWSPAIGLSNDTIAQPTAKPSATTTYTLITSNGICTSKDSVIVTVLPQPIANAGPDKTTCSGNGVIIGTAAVSGINYSWSPATGLNSSSSAQPTADPAATTTYTLTASNGSCNSTDTVIVHINPSPVANAGSNKSICNGDSTTIGTASVSGIKYSWSPAAGLSNDTIAQPTAKPTSTTTYTLTVSNGTCTNQATVIVTVLPQPVASAGPEKTTCEGTGVIIGTAPISGVTYTWSPSSGLSSSTSAQPTANPVSTTTYTLTASNGTCSSTDTVVVNVNPSPTANAGPNKSFCNGDSATIGTPSVPGTRYSWSPSTGLNNDTIAQPVAKPSSTTTYTLTASNGTCSNTSTVVVTILPQPVANAGANRTLCSGDSTTIGSSPIQGSGIRYSWSPSAGLSNDTIADPNASPASTTTYTLIVTNGSCSNSATVVITTAPKPTVSASSDKTICQNDSAMIGSPATAGLSYTWSPATGLNNSTASQTTASPSTTTTYTITASNGGCKSSDSVIVNVHQLPAANVGSGQTLCDAGSVQLGSPAVSGDTYLWTPATGLNSNTIAQPTANPDMTVVYTLTVTDTASGCSASNQVQITIEPTSFYTAISPNGDGMNDWWNIPMLNCYPTNHVIILNRWGSEVWSADNYDNENVKWAGTDNNGTNLPDGTYYYVIKYNNTEKKGWVFIKR